jgi:opacity protein-like surface antigen
MKKIILFVAFVLLTTASVNAQGFGWGIKGGINSATVSYDVNGTDIPTSTEAKIGTVAGAFLNFDLILVNLEVDALYSQKGFVVQIPGLADEEYTLNYLSVPAVAKFYLFPLAVKPYIAGGVEYSYLLSVSGDGISTDDFKTSDMGWVVAAGIDFNLIALELNADIRYISSFGDISNTADLSDFKNQAVQATIGVSF